MDETTFYILLTVAAIVGFLSGIQKRKSGKKYKGSINLLSIFAIILGIIFGFSDKR